MTARIRHAVTEEDYPHHKNGPVTAEDFANHLYDCLERNYDLDFIGLSRSEFMPLAIDVIYEAMIETGGIGIKK
jgi:hypothetical protein